MGKKESYPHVKVAPHELGRDNEIRESEGSAHAKLAWLRSLAEPRFGQKAKEQQKASSTERDTFYKDPENEQLINEMYVELWRSFMNKKIEAGSVPAAVLARSMNSTRYGHPGDIPPEFFDPKKPLNADNVIDAQLFNELKGALLHRYRDDVADARYVSTIKALHARAVKDIKEERASFYAGA